MMSTDDIIADLKGKLEELQEECRRLPFALIHSADPEVEILIELSSLMQILKRINYLLD